MISMKKKRRDQTANTTRNKSPKSPLKFLQAIEKHAAKKFKSSESNENKSLNKSKVKYDNLNELLKVTEMENSKSRKINKLSNKKKSQKTDQILDASIEKVEQFNVERPINNDKLKKKIKRLNKLKSGNSDISNLKQKSELLIKKSKTLTKKSISSKPIEETEEINNKSEDMIVKFNNLKQSKKSNKLEKQNLDENEINVNEKIKLKKGKLSKKAKKQKEKVLANLELTKEHVEKSVDVMSQLAEKQKQEKKTLFAFEDNPIFMQISCIKIPKVPRRRVRFVLPHEMIGPNDDVALFVTDSEKGRRQDYEKTIEHWESVLREKGVTRIKSIIPMSQVKNEYSQYEMRRKLARLHDLYLVDARITGHMCHLLGSTFTRVSKAPIPLRLYSEDLKKEIDIAMKKATLEIHGRGPCHTVQVATLSMTPDKIVENILAACERLKENYPGGFDNIRSILIKTKSGLGIPIYYSIKSSDEVPVPTLKPKRPKAYTTVEGELTTVESDVKVSVTPAGKVTVIPIKDSTSLNEEHDSNDDEKANKNTNATKKRKLTKTPFEQVETVNKHEKKKNDELIGKADASVEQDDRAIRKLKKGVKNTIKKNDSPSVIVNEDQNKKAVNDMKFDETKKRKIDPSTKQETKLDKNVKKTKKQLLKKKKKNFNVQK